MDILSDVKIVGHLNSSSFHTSVADIEFFGTCINGVRTGIYLDYDRMTIVNNKKYKDHYFNYVFTNIGPIPENCTSFIIGNGVCGDIEYIDVPEFSSNPSFGNHIILFKQVSNPTLEDLGFKQLKVVEADVSFVKNYEYATKGYIIDIAPHSEEITDLFVEFM